MTSSKLCPVSTCMTGNGMSAGAKAFTARCRSTAESFPPEKSSTGRSHSATTSRMMKIAWDSSRSRWSTRTGSAASLAGAAEEVVMKMLCARRPRRDAGRRSRCDHYSHQAPFGPEPHGVTAPGDTLLDELDAADRALANAAPSEVIEWALGRFDGNVAMACSFEDLVLVDLAIQCAPDLEVIFLDTGFHFPETIEFAHRFCDARGVNITVTTPGPEAAAWPCGTERCCELRKVAPLERALEGRDAWLTALKRVDAPTRTSVPIVGWDTRFGLVKCNPLATWTDD